MTDASFYYRQLSSRILGFVYARDLLKSAKWQPTGDSQSQTTIVFPTGGLAAKLKPSIEAALRDLLRDFGGYNPTATTPNTVAFSIPTTDKGALLNHLIAAHDVNLGEGLAR